MLFGKLICMGPIIPADFNNLFRWADDLEAARLNEPYRPAVWKNQEELWFNVGKDPGRVFFGIRKLGEQAIIGYVQIHSIDMVHRSAMLGLRIGDEAERGKGYGREALDLAVHYCWNHLNISKIGLVVFAINERAIKLYSDYGFEKEGLLKRSVFIDGRYVDVVLMGLMHPSR